MRLVRQGRLSMMIAPEKSVPLDARAARAVPIRNYRVRNVSAGEDSTREKIQQEKSKSEGSAGKSRVRAFLLQPAITCQSASSASISFWGQRQGRENRSKDVMRSGALVFNFYLAQPVRCVAGKRNSHRKCSTQPEGQVVARLLQPEETILVAHRL